MRKKFSIFFVENRLKINPTQSDIYQSEKITSQTGVRLIYTNPNESE